MSTVVADELITTLTQPIVVSTPLNIASIKPYILAVSPSIGALKLEILQGATVLFSKSLTFSEMKAMLNTTENNFHGFFPFFPTGSIYLSPGAYSIRLSATGYTFSTNNYVGWCKDHTRYFGNIDGSLPSDFRMYPYSFKLLEYQQRER